MIKRSVGRILLSAMVLLALAFLAGCLWMDQEPVATFERSPQAGDAPLSVFFDASESFDPEGEPLTYEWDFGDGGTAAGETPTHTYATPGTYEARLTVADPRGRASEFARMITVTDESSHTETGNDINQLAIDFVLKDLDGVEHALTDYRGYVILLDFWSSTCTPCQLTMPHLESLRERFADAGLVVIGVSIDTSEDEARAFITSNGYSEFVILHSSEAEARAVKSEYGVVGVPHTFVIDRQGVIRHADHPIRLRDRHIEPWL